MMPPIKDLQAAIAETIASEEPAYDIVGMCKYFGLPAKDDDNPWSSKRIYVLSLIKKESESSLIELATRVYERYQSDRLKTVLNQFIGGVSGEVKNIIFAANGPKPDLVLSDAVHNLIGIVANAEYCLVYDKPISSTGLLWKDLVHWWKEKNNSNENQAEQQLYLRLKASLGSKVEEFLFLTYYKEFKLLLGEQLPALIPQVYLHYDPKTLKELQGVKSVRKTINSPLLTHKFACSLSLTRTYSFFFSLTHIFSRNENCPINLPERFLSQTAQIFLHESPFHLSIWWKIASMRQENASLSCFSFQSWVCSQ